MAPFVTTPPASFSTTGCPFALATMISFYQSGLWGLTTAFAPVSTNTLLTKGTPASVFGYCLCLSPVITLTAVTVASLFFFSQQ
eukprot:4720626-Prorocentrum_lima.AAC.1